MSSLKIFILLFISSLSILSHAQTTDRTPYMSNVQLEYHNQEYKHSNPIDYKHSNEWKKYKTLRAIGWSALGVGIPTTLFGVVLSAFQNSLSGSGGVGIPLIVTGGVLTLSSIPLLTCAYHYRKKALNLTIAVSSIKNNLYSNSTIDYSPALNLAISF